MASEELIQRLRQLVPASAPTLVAEGHALGIGLATVVNMLNPQLVILGGLLAELFPMVQPQVQSALKTTALSASSEQVRVSVPELGAEAVLVGAAELAWQELLADPARALTSGS